MEPPAGGVRFRVASIPPNSPRFHVTNTVDYLYVLDGDITLELDDGSVLLHPGDCVVQRETNHSWRNDNDFPVRLVAVMVSLARDDRHDGSRRDPLRGRGAHGCRACAVDEREEWVHALGRARRQREHAKGG